MNKAVFIDRDGMDVSIIIPTKNEEKNLPHVLPHIPNDFEVILVDGHSTDKTVEVAKKLRPDIKAILQPGKGKGDAMRHGFQQAKGKIIITFDADGSFNTEEIASFVEPLLDGYDLTKGSRFLPGGGTTDMSLQRRMGNYIFTMLTNMLYGTRYTDLAYGFHAFKRDILEKIKLDSDGFEIDTELYLKAKIAGYRVAEVPSFESERLNGTGKLRSLSDGWRILRTIVKVRFTRQI